MSIGANILAPWVADRIAMYNWLARSRMRSVVVCDEPSVAFVVKAALPGARVFHRWVREGDGSFSNWTPDAYIRDFILPLPKGVWGYVLNEPGGDWAALAQWLVTVMRLAAPLNIPLVLGNFSKGNPPREVLGSGMLDPFFRAFNDFPNNFFGYHPYFKDDPFTDEHAMWHNVILERANRMARVRLLATEAGRDERGAYTDGYRLHIPSGPYGSKLTRQAAVLDQHGIDMTPFCFGKGGPIKINNVEVHHWEHFNYEDDSVVKDAITAYNINPVPPQEEDMAVPGYTKLITKSPGAVVNVRSAPKLGNNVVTTITTGVMGKRLGATVSADGYTWQPVVVDKDAASHIHGYVALEVVEFAP